jgi:hypothetical protein
MLTRFVTVVAAVLSLAVGACVAASADAPAPAPTVLPTIPPNVPLNPYVRAGIDIITGVVNRRLQFDANHSAGQVTYFKRFDMQVQTGDGSYRTIHLHQGTEIDPRGATIVPGNHVSIGGTAQSDGSLNADIITIQ